MAQKKKNEKPLKTITVFQPTTAAVWFDGKIRPLERVGAYLERRLTATDTESRGPWRMVWDRLPSGFFLFFFGSSHAPTCTTAYIETVFKAY